jgi:hypothetical protein
MKLLAPNSSELWGAAPVKSSILGNKNKIRKILRRQFEVSKRHGRPCKAIVLELVPDAAAKPINA